MLMTSTGRTFTNKLLGGSTTDIQNPVKTVTFPTRLKAKQLNVFNVIAE